jgi:hypothetical protein
MKNSTPGKKVETADRITIVVEDDYIVDVTSDDPTKISELTDEDRETISKNGFIVMGRTLQCRRYPDGKCYRVVANKKYKCTCAK